MYFLDHTNKASNSSLSQSDNYKLLPDKYKEDENEEETSLGIFTHLLNSKKCVT